MPPMEGFCWKMISSKNSGTVEMCKLQAIHQILWSPIERKSSLELKELVWANYNDVSRRVVTLNGGLIRELPQNPLNSGLGIILIFPDWYSRSLPLRSIGLVCIYYVLEILPRFLFFWWCFTDSTMVNHHCSPSFGRIFLDFFQPPNKQI